MRRIIPIIMVMLLIFVACNGKEVKLTPEQEKDRVYYEALNHHNEAAVKFTQYLSKYNLWCSNAEYLEACKEVDPYWFKANTVLDLWGEIVRSREPSATAEQNYRAKLSELKTKLLMEIPNYKW